jgi:hypothetical protein
LSPYSPARIVTLDAGRGRIRLQLVATLMGKDLSVALYGGDRPHIGAVALSQARPSHEAGGGVSATTSVLALTGHKEDELARALAARLAADLGGVACVACGIHVEAIHPEELKEVAALTEELTLELIRQLTGTFN